MTAPLVTSFDPSRLAPEDVYLRSPVGSPFDHASASGSRNQAARKTRDQRRNRSRSKRRKGGWKKLLWVKQSYPDNYTDEETFLDHLQRNPSLQPYEFWPLVGESTVILQQVCTMILFVCCFSGIIQERVSPVTVVGWGTILTVLGWVLWDTWVGQEEASKQLVPRAEGVDGGSAINDISSPASPVSPLGLGLGLPHLSAKSAGETVQSVLAASRRGSTVNAVSRRGSTTETGLPQQLRDEGFPESSQTTYVGPESKLSVRNQQRLATLKSALLIYSALLGLSPILKSLTKSTASDSIWAIAFWLMCINVVSFDYGGGVGATFPASLSTNAALMASTVLASRLPSTIHVFSLTLFSIEVFGLFPVFRRYLRHFSWHGHLLLTLALVLSAGSGVSMILSGGGWKAAIFGATLSMMLTTFALGLCALWLIGLQRHKNAIIGPWDAARPRIRNRQFD